MLVRPTRNQSSSSSVDTATTIMGMLMSVSRVNGIMCDEAYENMAAANGALKDESLQDTANLPPGDRVPLSDIESAIAPVLAFTLRDGTWRLAKARGAGGPAIKATGRLALDCCMCWSSAVTQAATHGTHPILLQMLAVRVPCCSACEQRAGELRDIGTECMSCLTNEAQCVMERADNHARAQLCQRCADAKWCQAMISAVGSTMHAIPSDEPSPAPVPTATPPPPPSSSPPQKKKKKPAATTSKKPAARKRKVDDAQTVSTDSGCAQCSDTAAVVTCGNDKCSTSLCAQCLRQRHGIMAAVYERQRGLWVCPDHID